MQDGYEIVGDSSTNEDHCGPAKARRSDSLLLHQFEICCAGSFHNLTPGKSAVWCNGLIVEMHQIFYLYFSLRK